MRRDIGEDHRTADLFSEQFDWWHLADELAADGSSNCCVRSISVSYHGKLHLERFYPRCGIGIRATKLTVGTDRGL